MSTTSNRDAVLRGYRDMLLIRRVEEAIARRYGEWRMRCPVHLGIGQEAIAAGVCGQLRRDDRVYGNHRAHGHYLAKGGDLNALVAELYGKADGCAGGRGGSMHLIDPEAGFMGSTPIVGGTLPLAVGSAWAERLRGGDGVTAVFFGDGCFEEGVLHESLNFAALHRLPVLFVCENNGYSVYTPLDQRQPRRPLHGIAAAHGLHSAQGDGNDLLQVMTLAGTAVERARGGVGPQFLELVTHRWLEHCGPNDDDELGYRRPGELAQWRSRDPLARTRRDLLHRGISCGELEVLETEVETQVEAAFAFAEASSAPDPESLAAHLFAPSTRSAQVGEGPRRRITYAEALREAQEEAMARDPRVILIGEGVPDPKAIFGTTAGLRQAFGAGRVHDAPLSENGVTGFCIGAAQNGLRPLLTHQRIDFALLSLDQLVNNAAKWRYLFTGRGGVPMVVRVIVGRGWGQGPQHGQALHALFGHVPGLKVVMPATAEDAKGMLAAAIADPDPVIFVEHRWLHHTLGEVPEGHFIRPLEGACIRRSGRDLTLAAFSHMVIEALRAAEWLAGRGIELEVVDMRSVTPLDSATVIDSVRHSGCLLVADIGHAKGGVAADLIAAVTAQAFSALRAAPRILALPDHPLPTSPFLADHYYPDAADLAQCASALCGSDLDPAEAIAALRRPEPRDQPDRAFVGPF